MAEIAAAGNAILRRELREMREEYEQLIENISKRVMERLTYAFRTPDITMPREVPGLLDVGEMKGVVGVNNCLPLHIK